MKTLDPFSFVLYFVQFTDTCDQIYCFKYYFKCDVASGSELTPCNKIDKPLVGYRFLGNVMTSITTIRTKFQRFYVRNGISK